MKAWVINVDGFDPMAVAAATRAKARYVTIRRAQEAGYSTILYEHIRAVRVPKLDAWAAKQEKPCIRALSEAEWEAR